MAVLRNPEYVVINLQLGKMSKKYCMGCKTNCEDPQTLLCNRDEGQCILSLESAESYCNAYIDDVVTQKICQYYKTDFP
jgi:hypothetical protein